jgi:hypothetical protein
MAIADTTGFPVAAHVESASPHEVKLVEATIDSSFTEYAPDKLVGDKAYDSDKLDDNLLNERGVEMIAPHRKGRKKPKTAGSSDAIGADGKWSACLPGFKTSGDWLFDTNTM